MKLINSIYITGVQFREAPKVNPVSNRPFTLELNDHSDLNAIAHTANESSSNLLPYDVANIAPSFISLSAPTVVSDIPNGYENNRCSYILNALIEYKDGSKEGVTIEGYTYDMDVISSLSNISKDGPAVNYNQRLYMVFVKTVALRKQKDAYGIVTGASNVILPDRVRRDNSDINIYAGSVIDNIGSTWKTQRPSDMFTNMMQEDTEASVGMPVLDLTNSLGMNSMGVNVAASSPAGYTSTVLNSYMNAVADIDLDSDAAFGDMTSSLYGSCQSRSSANTLSTNDLMLALRSQSDTALQGYFTLNDILNIDPTFTKDRISYYKLGKQDIHDFTLNSVEDHIVSIPGEMAANVNLLMNNFMSRADANKVTCIISNRSMDVTNPYVIEIIGCGSVDKQKAKFTSKAIYKMIHDELCPLLDTKFNESWVIEVDAISIMETKITVDCEGHERWFKVYPSYASTAFSPILVPPGVETGMTTGFTRLIDLIGVEDETNYNPLENTQTGDISIY